MSEQKNVLGTAIAACSVDPPTGWQRNGCCEADAADRGMHTVCALMTEEFLAYSRSVGNDLSTPRPEFGFPGLKAGDRWCVCAGRWEEARGAGFAPLVVLEATHEATLEVTALGHLQAHESDAVS